MTPRTTLQDFAAVFAALPLFTAAACSDARLEQRALSGSTMGTNFSVKLVEPPMTLDSEALQQEIEAELAKIETSMSTYIPDSELSRFNTSRTTDWFRTSPELCTIVESALDISGYTDGAFDVTVGPLVNLWGFGPNGSIAQPPDNEDIARVMENVGYEKLAADCTLPALKKSAPQLYVDLSAYAKGYAVDRLVTILDDYDLSNYLVEVGGELRMRGYNANRENWAIAVERPLQAGREVQSVVRLTDLAVATSGDYRNYFEHAGVRYSHTIDPNTGAPVAHSVASVTVFADSAAFADAIATALLVLGPVNGMMFAEQEDVAAYFLLHADDRIVESMTTRFATEIYQ
jgi:thiamine biosynthesis lipoprotein